MFGVKLEDRRPSTELSKCLDVEPVADVVRCGRLRWFGHVERKSDKDWVSACRGFVVGSAPGRGEEDQGKPGTNVFGRTCVAWV